MFDPSQYELLDFGDGRKLERFGDVVLDRPSPAAVGLRPARADLWRAASARFELDSCAASAPQRGQWKLLHEVPETWNVCHGSAVFDLKLTDFGHVGIFPEQAACWDWIGQQVHAARQSNEIPQVLNLFAYTGGSTLAAAAAEATVAHIDSAQNVMAWARRNATAASLAKAPIRWITEDALKFAKREVRRGRHYHGVILDPPSYGHGPDGEVWKIDDHLPELLSICGELTNRQPRFVLLTCHAPGYDAQLLKACLSAAGLARRSNEIESGDLWLMTSDDRRLHSGVFARNSNPNC